MFVSIRGRVLINVEALNMTESVGNYVKHRRIPVISPKTYVTYFVPAISGESIAHGFQEVLAEEAKKNGLPVCRLCEKGIFLKSTNLATFVSQFRDKLQSVNKLSSDFELEAFIIKNCLIEDIGGFLHAPETQSEKQFEMGLRDVDLLESKGIVTKEKQRNQISARPIFSNIKRTSNFYTGYMIPTKEALESVVIEPQLHSRYALGTPFVEGGQGQMIYYVELSSAVYTFSFDLDTRYIGKTTFVYDKAGEEVTSDRKKRIETTLNSIQKFLIEFMFGAKKTRFLPVVNWESLVIAISNDTWTVPSASSVNYIEGSIKKLEKINHNTQLFVYINPYILEDTSLYVKKKTEELLNSFYNALEEFRKKLEEKGDADKIDWSTFKKKKLEEFLEKKVNEIVESSDLKYTTKIHEKYKKAREVLENKGVKVYENFEECVVEAIEEAKKKSD